MEPYYADDSVTLYHGDCREVVPELPDSSVAMVLTDPPYGMNYTSGWSGATVALDGTRLCLRMYRELMPQIARVMCDGSHLYWFTRWDVLVDAADVIGAHVPVVNALVWDKGHPGMGDLKSYGFSYEMVLFGSKGRRALTGGRPNNIFRCNPVPVSHRQHPTEKPVSLLTGWIEKSTSPGELILDPFMGAGSSMVAARSAGRRFVGVEIEERYCEITARRLAQGSLFGDAA